MANIQRLLRMGLLMAFSPARIVEDATSAARRTAILAVCLLCAAIVLVPAFGCAAAGLWIIVQANIGPMWAAFITAIALMIVAVLLLLIGILASRRPSRRRERDPSRQATAAAAAAAAWPAAALSALPPPKDLAAAGRGLFARHKGTALLTAAIVGLVMGQDLLRPRAARRNARR